MEILKNEEDRVLRYRVEYPTYWWEEDNPPSDMNIVLQELSPDGEKNIWLSYRLLTDLLDISNNLFEQLLDNYNNPETVCCGQTRPRKECQGTYFRDRMEFRCLPGYGCKVKEAK